MANTKKVEKKNNDTSKKNISKNVAPKKEVSKTKKTAKVAVEVTEVKKENKVEEMAPIMDEKEKKTLNTSLLRNIGNVIFWTLFIVVAFIWIFDFVRVIKEEDPKFCLNNKVHEYEDGKVKECVGLGYKVFNYNRTSMGTGYEFGPFFVKVKENNIND